MQDMEETKREAAQVVELLDLRQGGLTQTLDGGFPELRNSVWQSEISVQSAVQVCTCCRGSHCRLPEPHALHHTQKLRTPLHLSRVAEQDQRAVTVQVFLPAAP